MSGFCNLRLVKTARQPCRCEQCGNTINPGERKFVAEGMWDGDFFRSHEHPECMVAKLDFHHEFGRYDDEAWPSFWREGLTAWEADWLRLRHPDAAKRLRLLPITSMRAAP